MDLHGSMVRQTHGNLWQCSWAFMVRLDRPVLPTAGHDRTWRAINVHGNAMSMPSPFIVSHGELMTCYSSMEKFMEDDEGA